MAVLTRLRRALSDQLSNPSGAGGRLVARAMNRGNRDMNGRAIDLLDVQSGHRVLDLGFGGGVSFAPLLERGATVVGVDRAEDMVQAARDRHGDEVTVHVGDVTALPLGDGAVDRVLTVNTVYFWSDLAAGLREVHRVLAPGGRVVIGIRDGSVMKQVDRAVFTIRTPQELTAALTNAGFAGAEVRSADDGATHLVTATRAAGTAAG